MKPPTLEHLLKQFLAQGDASSSSEVEPYQQNLTVATWLEPKQLWPSAMEAVQELAPAHALESIPDAWLATWQRLLRELHSQPIVWFAFGHVPAMLRQLDPLLDLPSEASPLAPWQPTPGVNWHFAPASDQDPRSMLFLAMLQRCQGHWDQAAASLAKVRQVAPADWTPWLDHETAVLHAMSGEGSLAEAHWRQAVPPSFASLYNLGLLSFHRGQFKLARERFEKALPLINPASPWHHLTRLYLECLASRAA